MCAVSLRLLLCSCTVFGFRSKTHAVIEGNNHEGSPTELHSRKLGSYCPGFQSGRCSRAGLESLCQKAEVRDGFSSPDISLLIIPTAGCVSSPSSAANKHFPLLPSHSNEFPWLPGFSFATFTRDFFRLWIARLVMSALINANLDVSKHAVVAHAG